MKINQRAFKDSLKLENPSKMTIHTNLKNKKFNINFDAMFNIKK